MVKPHPLHRRLATFFVALSLLFSQLALASYVCPKVPDTNAMAEMMAAGEPCQGMDADQPVLGFQHAADMSLSFEQAKVATPSLPAVVQIVIMPVVLVSEGHAVPERQHPPPDPIFLSTRRLRV